MVGPALETTTAPPQEPPIPLQVPDTTTTGPSEPAEGAPETPVEGTPEPVTLPEGWHDHPDAKARLAEQYQQGQSRGDRAYRRQLQEVEANYDERVRQTAQTAQASEVVQKIGQELAALADSPDVAQDLQRVLSRNESWTQVFQDARYGQGRGDFARDLSTKLYQGLPDEFSEDLADVVSDLNAKLRRGQLKDADAFEKMMLERDKILKKAWEADYAKEYDKKANEVRAAADRAAGRNGQPPATVVPTTPASGFSSIGDADIAYADNKISHEEYKRLRQQFGIKDTFR